MLFLLMLACIHATPSVVTSPVAQIDPGISVHHESSPITGAEFSFLILVAQQCPMPSDARVCIAYITTEYPQDEELEEIIKLFSRHEQLNGEHLVYVHGFYNHKETVFFQGAYTLDCNPANPCSLHVDLKAGADGHVLMTSSMSRETLEWEIIGSNIYPIQRIQKFPTLDQQLRQAPETTQASR